MKRGLIWQNLARPHHLSIALRFSGRIQQLKVARVQVLVVPGTCGVKKFYDVLVASFQPRDNVGCRSGSSIISRIWPIAFLQRRHSASNGITFAAHQHGPATFELYNYIISRYAITNRNQKAQSTRSRKASPNVSWKQGGRKKANAKRQQSNRNQTSHRLDSNENRATPPMVFPQKHCPHANFGVKTAS